MSWSTSAPAPTPPLRVAADSSVPPPSSSSSSSSSFSRTPSAPSRPSHHHHNDDDDALPQRTSKPPIKTYEARQRIGLKLKIKQEAGLSKVVHNTALDPVHSQPQHHSQPPTPEVQPPPPPPQQQPKATPAFPPTTASVIRTPAPPPTTCNTVASSSNSTVTTHSGLSQRDVPPSYPWSSSSSSSSSSTSQMNGTLEHHDVAGPKCTPVSTSTPCRLPLRKTYRENVSPRIRPGVPGGGCEVVSNPPPPVSSTPAFPPALSSSSPPPPSQLRASPQPERTVIASVKLEHQGGRGQERGGASSGGSGGEGVAQGASQPLRSPPGLAEVEDVFYRGIKNAYHRHHRHRPPEQAEGGQDEEAAAPERDSDGGALRSKRFGGKNRERPSGTFRMDQHAPGPPSPSDGSSFTRDSSLPAKRCKSDSPDMDNASFSSGSPPPDDSLNEHLQCAIDSILNLQQGPAGHTSGRGVSGRPPGPHVHHHPHQPQRTVTSSSSSYRPSSSTAPSSSSSAAQQVGGRGQNGSLVTQTHNR